MPGFGAVVFRDLRFPGEHFVDCGSCHYTKAHPSKPEAAADRDTHVCNPRRVLAVKRHAAKRIAKLTATQPEEDS